MNQLVIKNVTHKFGDLTALNHVNLTLEEGKIYALLGRNGAGKSTLLNIISNRIFATQGEVLVNGLSSVENDNAQCQVFLMSESDYYPSTMRVKEVFRWTKEFYNGFDMEKALVLSKQFGLDTKKKVSELSTGYKTIYKFITALCVDVPYVFLDEPILGLDANHRELFYKTLIEAYSENPRTFVISTHLIEEISGLAEHIIIIDHGTVLKDQSCDELLHSGYTVSGKVSVIDSFIADKEVIGIDTLGGLKSAYIIGNLDKTNLPSELEISHMDLQKLFIQLTNNNDQATSKTTRNNREVR